MPLTNDERIDLVQKMLGEDADEYVLMVYLNLAEQKILNHRYPYGTTLTSVEERYEKDLIELAVVLYSMRGAEGQETHNENGVNRKWRTETQILNGIPRMVGIPL